MYWVFYDDFTDAQPLSFLKFKVGQSTPPRVLHVSPISRSAAAQASVRGVLSDMHLRRVHRLMAGLASGDLSAPAASFSDFLGFAVNYLTKYGRRALLAHARTLLLTLRCLPPVVTATASCCSRGTYSSVALLFCRCGTPCSGVQRF